MESDRTKLSIHWLYKRNLSYWSKADPNLMWIGSYPTFYLSDSHPLSVNQENLSQDVCKDGRDLPHNARHFTSARIWNAKWAPTLSLSLPLVKLKIRNWLDLDLPQSTASKLRKKFRSTSSSTCSWHLQRLDVQCAGAKKKKKKVFVTKPVPWHLHSELSFCVRTNGYVEALVLQHSR